jgi:hypothetical protein
MTAEPLVPLPPDEGRHAVVQVQVRVLEDGVPIGSAEIGYYRGQEYTVPIETPDGVDRVMKFTAGEGV